MLLPFPIRIKITYYPAWIPYCNTIRGIGRVTTLPAPITLFSPIVDPGIEECMCRRQSRHCFLSLSDVHRVLKNVVLRSRQFGTSLSCGNTGCEDVYICTSTINTLSPPGSFCYPNALFNKQQGTIHIDD